MGSLRHTLASGGEGESCAQEANHNKPPLSIEQHERMRTQAHTTSHSPAQCQLWKPSKQPQWFWHPLLVLQLVLQLVLLLRMTAWRPPSSHRQPSLAALLLLLPLVLLRLQLRHCFHRRAFQALAWRVEMQWPGS